MLENCKHDYRYQIGSQVLSIKWRHGDCCTSSPWTVLRWVTRERWEQAEESSRSTFRGWYLPSNGTMAKVMLRNIDLRLQGYKFETLLSWIQWKSYDFCGGYYRGTNGTIVNAILRNLDIHFQGQAFSCYAFTIKNCSECECSRQICLDWHGPAVELLLLFVRWVLFFELGALIFK